MCLPHCIAMNTITINDCFSILSPLGEFFQVILGSHGPPSVKYDEFMPHSSPAFTSDGVGAHINCSASNSIIIIDKTVGRVIHKVVRIFTIYKEAYQIHCIELCCNYSLFVYTFCILSIYIVTHGSDIFSINDMCIINY